MKKLLLSILLISSTSFAKRLNGYFEVSKYLASNVPTYNDYNGQSAEYGLDLKLNIPTGLVWDRLDFMIGADARGAHQGFTQAAGRCAISLDVFDSFQVGFFHRSSHNFDFQPVNLPTFYSDNRFFIKYRFSAD